MLSDERIDELFKLNHSMHDSPWIGWRRFARAIEREATDALIEQIKEDEALIRRALDVLEMWHTGECPSVATIKTVQAIRQRLECKK